MTTYKLPEALGGGECEIAEHLMPTGAWPNHVVVKVPDERVGGWYVLVPKDALTPIEPALPPEPPVGSHVNAGSRVLHRRDDAGIDWRDLEGDRWLTWTQVCELGTPVLLVPGPEPVALPWECKGHSGDRVAVEESHEALYPRHIFVCAPAEFITPNDAREMARALNTAADQAEATS